MIWSKPPDLQMRKVTSFLAKLILKHNFYAWWKNMFPEQYLEYYIFDEKRVIQFFRPLGEEDLIPKHWIKNF